MGYLSEDDGYLDQLDLVPYHFRRVQRLDIYLTDLRGQHRRIDFRRHLE